MALIPASKKIYLYKVTTPKGKTFYQYTIDGQTYKTSYTAREYVAMLIQGTGVAYRFGRVDLIGKGDSKTAYESGNFDYIAVLPDYSKHIIVI